jgi:phosphatidylserine/phosphatidylglycerophosphate/cardiolipin synthase-like enzyme
MIRRRPDPFRVEACFTKGNIPAQETSLPGRPVTDPLLLRDVDQVPHYISYRPIVEWTAPTDPPVLGLQQKYPEHPCLERLLHMIGRAQTEVVISAYTFDLHVIINALWLRLRDISTFRFFIMVEGNPALTPHPLAQRTYFTGGELRHNTWFDTRPNDPQGMRKHHSKFVVIDRKHVITGSSNFTSHAFQDQANNLVFLVDERELALQYRRTFLHRWNRTGRPLMDDFYDVRTKGSGGRGAFKEERILFPSPPVDNMEISQLEQILTSQRGVKNSGKTFACFTRHRMDFSRKIGCQGLIHAMLDNASRIRFCVHEFFPPPEIVELLVRLSERIPISVVANAVPAETRLSMRKAANTRRETALRNTGTTPILSIGCTEVPANRLFIHHKFIRMDTPNGRHVVTGSANYGFLSFNTNVENMMFLLDNDDMSDFYDQQYDDILEFARVLPLSTSAQYNLLD